MKKRKVLDMSFFALATMGVAYHTLQNYGPGLAAVAVVVLALAA
ncbi:hypothetical protein [Arthrobacter sp. FW306-04-A]